MNCRENFGERRGSVHSQVRALATAAIERNTAIAIGIVGRGGSGKSEILAELVEATELTTHFCAGRRLETDLVLGGIEDLLTPGELGEVEAVSGSVATTKARRILSAKLAGCLLVVDDAQWLDSESLAVLTALADRASQSNIRMVVAHRPSENSELGALDEALARTAALMILEPLDAISVAERIKARINQEPAPSLVEEVHYSTGGVIRYLDLLVEGWQSTGAIEDGNLVGEGELPSQLIESIRSRIGQLTHEARAIVQALAFGATATDDYLPDLLGVSQRELSRGLGDLDAAGFLNATLRDLLPAVSEAVVSITPVPEQRDFHSRFAAVLVERGGSAVVVAEHLAEAKVAEKQLIPSFVLAGDELATESPELALAWYDRALQAGGSEVALAAKTAEAHLWAGDAEEALRVADPLLEQDADDRLRGLQVIAAALTARGRLRQASAVYERLFEQSDDQALFLFQSVPGYFATGEMARAKELLTKGEAITSDTAGLSLQAARLTAQGLMSAASGEVSTALHILSSAAEAAESAPVDRVLGDSPHALAATLASLAGEYDVADSLLTRALDKNIGGPAILSRHLLLQSLVRMSSGDWSGVQDVLVRVQDEDLAPRDELVLRALQAGLARRTSDMKALKDCWRLAHDVMVRHPVDLFALVPLGELIVAGSRLGDAPRVAPWVGARDQLLDDLGQPIIWLMHAQWADLQAAAAADDLKASGVAAKALAAVVPPTSRLSVLPDAAKVWGAVLAKKVVNTHVEKVADRLHDAGFKWEAARLVGMAALRATDDGAAKSLLAKARELRSSLSSASVEPSSVISLLSERELEVAASLVDGRTYKEIGSVLFISPKTVEHHVAKIRQRLGSNSRAELLATLRNELS